MQYLFEDFFGLPLSINALIIENRVGETGDPGGIPLQKGFGDSI
jgi:hypothetical protein